MQKKNMMMMMMMRVRLKVIFNLKLGYNCSLRWIVLYSYI